MCDLAVPEVKYFLLLKITICFPVRFELLLFFFDFSEIINLDITYV